MNKINLKNKSPDFKKINALALQNEKFILPHFLPGGKYEGKQWIALNPRREDKTLGSFTTSIETGLWKDFANGAGGGDLVSLIGYVKNCTDSEAAHLILDFLDTIPKSLDQHVASPEPASSNDPSPWKPVPAPPDRPPPEKWKHPKFGDSSSYYDYFEGGGLFVMRLFRYNLVDGGKTFRPVSFHIKEEDPTSGAFKFGAPELLPLYHLRKILDNPTRYIGFTEGEKDADALESLLPDIVSTTTAFGALSPEKTDFSPLDGRRVLIWPDNDLPGWAYAEKLVRLCILAGAKTVEIFNLDFFKFGPRKRGAKSTPGFRGELPKGWGAWDAKEEGFSPEALETFLRDDTFYIAPKSLFYPEVPEGYFKRKDGIYRVIEKAKEEEPGLQKICSLIEIEALTRDSNDTNWGRRLVIEDIDGGRHSWNMPMGLYGHDPKEVRTELFRLGATLNQSPAAKHAFDEYIQNTNPSGRFIIAGKTGWLDHGTFVLPHRTISCISSRVLYQSEVAVLDHVKNSGTLEDWQNEVCRLTVANSRLIFAIAVALSGPLLNVTGEKNYGCHIVGISSTGKTTNLQVAASVWGPHGFIQTWRATDNGLEAVAESHSDLVLLLDEIAEISPKVLGKTVYMLVNGLGKKRMKADSSLRVSKKWRLPILSVGETTLKTAIEQDSSNPMVRAGQELRLLSIEAESTGSQGLFNCIHEFTDASEFARHLSTVTKNHFGVAGPSFVRALIKLGPRKIGLLWGKYKKKFFKDVVPKNSTAQVCRTANTFALIAFTSFLSSRLGITVWTPHEAEEAIAQCFRDWMNSLDSQMPDIDSGPILSRVRTFFEAHAESRFSELDKERRGRATLNRAGFVNRGSDGDIVEYLVLPQVFRSEFCKGFTHKHVTTVLIDNGILVPGERRRTSQSRLIKGESRTRLYVFPASKVLEGGEQ